MAFCPNCGSNVDGQFCAKCGATVAAAPSGPAQPPYSTGPAAPPPAPGPPPPAPPPPSYGAPQGYQTGPPPPYQAQPGYQAPPPGYQSSQVPPPYQQGPPQQPYGGGYQPGPPGGGMQENVASLLCYVLGWITGIIFLVMDPYKNNRNIKFHAWQSIIFSGLVHRHSDFPFADPVAHAADQHVGTLVLDGSNLQCPDPGGVDLPDGPGLQPQEVCHSDHRRDRGAAGEQIAPTEAATTNDTTFLYAPLQIQFYGRRFYNPWLFAPTVAPT